MNTLLGPEPTTLAGAQLVCNSAVDTEARDACEAYYREKFAQPLPGRLGELMQQQQDTAATKAEALMAREQRDETVAAEAQRLVDNARREQQRQAEQQAQQQQQYESQSGSGSEVLNTLMGIFGSVIEATTSRRSAPSYTPQRRRRDLLQMVHVRRQL